MISLTMYIGRIQAILSAAQSNHINLPIAVSGIAKRVFSDAILKWPWTERPTPWKKTKVLGSKNDSIESIKIY